MLGKATAMCYALRAGTTASPGGKAVFQLGRRQSFHFSTLSFVRPQAFMSINMHPLSGSILRGTCPPLWTLPRKQVPYHEKSSRSFSSLNVSYCPTRFSNSRRIGMPNNGMIPSIRRYSYLRKRNPLKKGMRRRQSIMAKRRRIRAAKDFNCRKRKQFKRPSIVESLRSKRKSIPMTRLFS